MLTSALITEKITQVLGVLCQEPETHILFQGFPGSSDNKESICNAGGLGLIPESESSPGEGNGNPSSILAQRIPWTEEPGGL